MAYVVLQSEVGLYTVGFYSPDGTWHPVKDCASSEEAQRHAHYLNGGSSQTGNEAKKTKVPSKSQVLAPKMLDFIQRWREIIDGGGKGAEQWAEDFDTEAQAILKKVRRNHLGEDAEIITIFEFACGCKVTRRDRTTLVSMSYCATHENPSKGVRNQFIGEIELLSFIKSLDDRLRALCVQAHILANEHAAGLAISDGAWKDLLDLACEGFKASDTYHAALITSASKAKG